LAILGAIVLWLTQNRKPPFKDYFNIELWGSIPYFIDLLLVGIAPFVILLYS